MKSKRWHIVARNAYDVECRGCLDNSKLAVYMCVLKPTEIFLMPVSIFSLNSLYFVV